MIIDAKYNQTKINGIRKGDTILLRLQGSAKDLTEVKVLVQEIVSDIQKCGGCGIRLDNRASFKLRAGIYCEDCYNRRRDEMQKNRK